MSNLKLEEQVVELGDENISDKCERFIESVITKSFNFGALDQAIIEEKKKMVEFYEKAQFI